MTSQGKSYHSPVTSPGNSPNSDDFGLYLSAIWSEAKNALRPRP
jgi:hypothetical protein